MDASPAGREVGRVIAGKWTLERLLGEGGMGAVYQARDAAGQRVAIKLLHREMSARNEIRERFLREGLAAGRVAHPGAVSIFEQALDGDTAYLVMELLEGRSLGEALSAGKMGATELFGHLEQVLDVLASAHAQGIVHRDLKPDNLFITNQGRVKVLDFGVAKFLDGLPPDQRTRTGIAMGTLSYMAPEQALGRGDLIDGRTDLYALGAMCFRVLSGRRVHEGVSDAEVLVSTITRQAPPLSSVAPDVPLDAAQVIDMALRFDREQRYVSAEAMRDDVRAFLTGKPAQIAQRNAALREEATFVPVSHARTEIGTEPGPDSVARPLPTEPDAPSLPLPARVGPTQPDALPPLSAPLWFWLLTAAGLLVLGGVIGLALAGDDDPIQPEPPAAPSSKAKE